MPSKLSSGFVDTGITTSVSYSGSMRIKLSPFTVSNPPPPSPVASIGFWTLYNGSFAGGGPPCGPGEAEGYWRVLLDGPMNTPHTPWQTEYQEFSCRPDVNSESGWYSVSTQVGPLRLGMRYVRIGSTPKYPDFWTDYEVQYSWFADRNTVLNTSCSTPDGTFYGDTQYYTTHVYPWSFEQEEDDFDALGFALGVGGPGSLQFQVYNAGPGGNPDYVFANFAGLATDNRLVDTSELNFGPLVGTGGGSVEGRGFSSGNPPTLGQVGYWAYWTEDIDVTAFGGGSTGALIRDSDTPSNTYQCPVRVHRSYQWVNWPRTEPSPSPTRSFTIDSTWASEQPVPFRSDDRQIMLMMKPKDVGGGAYYPLTLLISETLDINRPDGASTPPSEWEPSDTGKITVTENATNTVFSVSNSSGTATRMLTQQWKHRVGIYGTSDPDFGIVEYQHTKHMEEEDIYCWDTYSFLWVDLTAPASGDITLTLDGNYLSVVDPHTTGSDRVDNYEATLTPFSYQYVIPAQTGRHTYYLDLCFPENTDGPVYPSRIDEMTLSDFHTGTYTLHALQLKARGNAYLKVDYGPPVQRQDYSAIWLALDGSSPTGALPDQAYKYDEVGASPQAGGGIRFVEPLTGAVTGIVQDSQMSLTGFWGVLNGMEGISAEYSLAASDAALEDAYGTKLTCEGLAQTLQPLVPFAVDDPHSAVVPDVEYHPPCSLNCRQVTIPPGHGFTVYSRWNAGYGALEALVVDEDTGLRAEAGIELTAGSGSLGVTDEYGFVIVTPVPANGSVSAQISGA